MIKVKHILVPFFVMLCLLQSCYVTKERTYSYGYTQRYFETEIRSEVVTDIDNSAKGELLLTLSFLFQNEVSNFWGGYKDCFGENTRIVVEQGQQPLSQIPIRKNDLSGTNANQIKKTIPLDSGMYRVFLVLDCPTDTIVRTEENNTKIERSIPLDSISKVPLGAYKITNGKQQDVYINVNRQITARSKNVVERRKRKWLF